MYTGWFLPPSTPSAFDDDFTQGDPDLAVRGWAVVGGNTGTTMTRAGPVIPWTAPTTIPANQYRSSITKSGILLQTNQNMMVSKAITPPFMCWAVSTYCGIPNANGSYGGTIEAFGSYPFDASVPTRRRVYPFYNNNSLDLSQMDINNAYTSLVATKDYAAERGHRTMLGSVVACDASKNVRLAIMDAQRDALIMAYSYNWAAFTPAAVGIELRTSDPSALPGNWILVRSVRMAPSFDAWPGMY